MGPILKALNEQFVTVDRRSRELLALLDQDQLFRRPDGSPTSMTPFSCGEYLLRSAGRVEMTFGGITTRLWDDPFEWTLPEQLSTNELILQYLEEVEATRQQSFTFFQTDDDLKKSLPAPVKIITLFELLLETLATAENYQGRAIAIFRLFSNEKLF